MTGSGEWVRVSDFASRDEASRAGAMLLESGIVATLEEGDGTTALAVLPDDVARACELLDVAPPQAAALPLDEPLSPEAVRWRLPRERLHWFVIGYVAVLVGVAAVVFLVVVWLLGGFDSTEMPNTTFPS